MQAGRGISLTIPVITIHVIIAFITTANRIIFIGIIMFIIVIVTIIRIVMTSVAFIVILR